MTSAELSIGKIFKTQLVILNQELTMSERKQLKKMHAIFPVFSHICTSHFLRHNAKEEI
jgi:hypothetical protein